MPPALVTLFTVQAHDLFPLSSCCTQLFILKFPEGRQSITCLQGACTDRCSLTRWMRGEREGRKEEGRGRGRGRQEGENWAPLFPDYQSPCQQGLCCGKTSVLQVTAPYSPYFLVPIKTTCLGRHRLTSLENEFMVTSGEGWGVSDELGGWDRHTHTTIFEIDSQQGWLYSTENFA